VVSEGLLAGAVGNTVLVVDDEESIRSYLSDVLSHEGYGCRCFSESLKALAYLCERDQPADLMLADINMPGMGGMDLLRNVKSTRPELPVILISGLYELALALDALQFGADDFLKKPVRPQDVLTAVGKYLLPKTGDGAAAVQVALRRFVRARRSGGETTSSIEEVFQLLGTRRYETMQHSQRVAAHARTFGEVLGLAGSALEHIELGSLLHDIGKIGIPRNVLLKPGKLDSEEWRVMREHPAIGYRLLAEFDDLQVEAAIVLAHHERFDGGGYPLGLRGKEIPLGARIFSIVDTFDAITSNRPYRAAHTSTVAKPDLERTGGRQFDPDLATVFLGIPDTQLAATRVLVPDESESPVPAA
jgi:response regulator RpfG family c-di-GMP phosphodiesterase